MRNTFLALVLANLGFAAWAAWFAAPSATRPTPGGAAAGITLISELEPDAIEAIDTSAPPRDPPRLTAPPTSAADESCISIGPFQELAQASAAQGILRDAGYMPSQRVVDGEIWVGYWVHLADIPTREAASDILAELHANDISDSYIVPRSETMQTISLGVFSEINRAASVRERVRALGYDPTVADRSRSATLYWIDIVTRPDRTIDLEALQSPGRINRLEQRRCSSVGG